MKPFHTSLLCALVAAAALPALQGCRSVKPQPVARVEPVNKMGDHHYIADRRIITDPNMAKTLSIGYVNTAETAEGLLKVQVELTNLTDKFESVEYRYEWTDANGMLVETPVSRWKIEKLKPRDSVMVMGVAPSPAVKDFVFKCNTRMVEVKRPFSGD